MPENDDRWGVGFLSRTPSVLPRSGQLKEPPGGVLDTFVTSGNRVLPTLMSTRREYGEGWDGQTRLGEEGILV